MQSSVSWSAIDRQSLLSARTRPATWEALYAELVPEVETSEGEGRGPLRVLDTLLRIDLGAFAEQSGQGRLAGWSCRIKPQKSFIDKMLRVGADVEARRRKFPKGQPAPPVFSFLPDMVAARQVFFFERDIQEAIIFWMSFPSYYPIDVTHWVQDLSGYDNDLPAAGWLRRLGVNVTRKPKESGYESLHIVLGLNVDLLIRRCEVAGKRSPLERGISHTRREDGKTVADLLSLVRRYRDVLDKVRFEIQCRTILEHTWAEIEHATRYSRDKAIGDRPAAQSDTIRRTFRSYKASLRASQVFQNSIRAGFSLWDIERKSLTGRSTLVHVGARAEYWPPQAQDRIRKIEDALRKATLASRKERTDVDPWAEAWDVFRAEATSIQQLSGPGEPWERLIQLATDIDLQEYKRRRIIAMLLGYLLSYWTWEPRRRRARERLSSDAAKRVSKHSRVRDEAAAAFYAVNMPSAARQAAPAELAVVRLYETLRLFDAFYGGRDRSDKASGDEFLDDPLVPCRAGSVYFRHYGSYRRSTQLLLEGLERSQRWTASGRAPEWVFSPKYILRRLVENAWSAYHLEGRRPGELEQAMKYARQALNTPPPTALSTDEDRDGFHLLEQKLCSFLLTFSFYQEVAKGPAPDTEWAVLTAMWRKCGDERDRVLAVVGGPATEDSLAASLRLQGRALLECVRANEATVAQAINRHLVEARRLIRLARQNVVRKVVAGKGGALQFHIDSAREIEGFIHALCIDQHRCSRIDDAIQEDVPRIPFRRARSEGGRPRGDGVVRKSEAWRRDSGEEEL